MFNQFLSVFKKADLLTQALKDTDLMFRKSSQLYSEAVGALAEGRDPEFDIYQMDREINGLEKKIRRKVLENLSINPQQEIVASLVLTSIIIDIERIGDYSKNILEVRNLCTARDGSIIELSLMKDAGRIAEIFKQTLTALSEGDEETARDLMSQLNALKKGFDGFISALAEEKISSPRRTVVNLLFARYLKRVAAHLENVASSIAFPFDMIGFYPGLEEGREEEAD